MSGIGDPTPISNDHGADRSLHLAIDRTSGHRVEVVHSCYRGRTHAAQLVLLRPGCQPFSIAIADSEIDKVIGALRDIQAAASLKTHHGAKP